VYALGRINSIARLPSTELERLREGRSNPLFEAYPRLALRIPWRPLGAFPTPIHEMPDTVRTSHARIFVKRDDLSSGLYGGNKVRKLEYFLAEAEVAERRTLVTLGGIGSNHALAVATHGRALGFDIDLALYDQPVTPAVRRNLGGFLAAGARLHYAGSTPRAFLTARRVFAERAREQASPYFIMVGGSSRLGCLGYVNAGFELAQQVREGTLPEPDLVFVPLGTCGTAAGLIVGLRLAGLATRVAAVRVADPFPANAVVLRLMAQDIADFLSSSDPAVPRLRISMDEFDVLPHYLGNGYGHPTAAAELAVESATPYLSLETTYTGKTLAACWDHCGRGGDASTVLYWNTYSSAPVARPDTWDGIPPALNDIVS
jgi:D-cysteine desulfhydrase